MNLLIAVGVAAVLAAIGWAFVRRRRLVDQAEAPSVEEQVGSGLLQAMSRAREAWIDGLSVCPGCEAVDSVDAPYIPHPRGIQTRRARTLTWRRRDSGTRISRCDGPHYTTWQLDVDCSACGYHQMEVRSDDPPFPEYGIGRLTAPVGPRVRWELTRDGQTATVLAGERGSSVSAAAGPIRFAALQARVLIDCARTCNLDPLPLQDHEAMREKAITRLVGHLGVTVVPSRLDA